MKHGLEITVVRLKGIEADQVNFIKTGFLRLYLPMVVDKVFN